MFNYLERKTEKRIFYSYLHHFDLTQEQLGPKVSRLLLNEIYRQSNVVSKRFGEPLAVVSRNIISAAAWGVIYCLLGANRMVEMRPDYWEIVDEVEMELMQSYTRSDSDFTIYREIYAILAEHNLCHPEVTALIEACMLTRSADLAFKLPVSAAGS